MTLAMETGCRGEKLKQQAPVARSLSAAQREPLN
jgi:hypothetical protein